MGNIKYQDYNWVNCVDLKIVNCLVSQQEEYRKFPCYVNLCDSRGKGTIGHKKFCQCGKSWKLPLVSRDRMILPPHHIKLGMMKEFVKAIDKITNDSILFHASFED